MMNLYGVLRNLAVAMVLISTAFAADALDLPVKDINGKECYVYTVGENESLYSIAHKLGIGREDITRYNPSATDGVRQGQQLYFPVSEYASTYGTATSTILHEVKNGETLYGLAHKYNVTAEDIVSLNPGASQGLRSGQVLTIPMHAAKKNGEASDNGSDSWREANRTTPANGDATAHDDASDKQAAADNSRKTAQNAPDRGHRSQAAPDETGDEDVTKALDPENTTPDNTEAADNAGRKATVALIMPFMLDESKPTRQAQLVTDFYRGFLIAADTMASELPDVQLLVYDTRNNTERLQNYLTLEKRLEDAALIIAPDNAEHLAMIAEYGRTHNVPVLNNFVVKDTLFRDNPMLLHGNIESDVLMNRAGNFLAEQYASEEMLPVILMPEGRADKKAFTDGISEILGIHGVHPLIINYEGALTYETLNESLPSTARSRYFIICGSGTLNEFNRVAGALKRYGQELEAAGGVMRVLGYPEWITFRGEALETMHELDVTIYSRFVSDPNSYDVQSVENSFKKWYGHAPLDGLPSQALWGFDTGCFVFSNLIENWPLAGRNDRGALSWRGVQSAFNFDHHDGSQGTVNNSMYFIRYMPGGTLDVTLN